MNSGSITRACHATSALWEAAPGKINRSADPLPAVGAAIGGDSTRTFGLGIVATQNDSRTIPMVSNLQSLSRGCGVHCSKEFQDIGHYLFEVFIEEDGLPPL